MSGAGRGLRASIDARRRKESHATAITAGRVHSRAPGPLRRREPARSRRCRRWRRPRRTRSSGARSSTTSTRRRTTSRRLEEIFGQLGISGSGETCEAMRGLIKEGEKTIAIARRPDGQGRCSDRFRAARRALRDRRVRHRAHARGRARLQRRTGSARPDARRRGERRQAAHEDRDRRNAQDRSQRAGRTLRSRTLHETRRAASRAALRSVL